ncbi:MAG: C39 family peptidase [Aeromicrobium sp.]
MRLLPLLGTALVSTATVAAMVTPPAQAASGGTTFSRWTYTADFAQGSFTRAAAAKGTVTMTSGTSAAWTSPWKSVGFSAKSLVPSWGTTTPSGTSAVIEARVRKGGTIGSWDTVATWAGTRRSSGSSQRDDLARLETDTIVAASTFDAWQVRITLRRTSAKSVSPALRAINGVAASYQTRTPATSTTGMTRTVELAVSSSSQMTHRGHYAQWGNGGEAWCSPTSTSMIMRYFGKGPSASTYAWTKERHGYVDHAARYTYDSAYEGTGNWSFNTAYAAGYGLDAFVTRLDSLREAEAFIKAGIPLVASVAYSKGQLTGAPISSTPGHLLVIRGFRSDGAVIVNDPAGSSDQAVRRTYSRAQFERAWQRGSGGIVYVIRPLSIKLPSDTPRW